MAQSSAHTANWGGVNYGSQIDENRGTVINNFGVPVNRVESPPVPSSNVPYRRDDDFVARGYLLDDLAERCAWPASRVALVGIGGVGKSQLAIELCHRLHISNSSIWIFWIHASNVSRIRQGFREIAEVAKIPGRENPSANILQLVSRWLRDERHGKWLLVLDSLDEYSCLSTEPETTTAIDTNVENLNCHSFKKLSSYLPQSDHGTVFITSRRRDVAEHLVNRSEIILLDTMNEREAKLLLVKKLQAEYSNMDDSDVSELVTILGHMPLAIAQAAAYICQRKPRYSVRQYINEFQCDERQRSKLLGQEADSLRRDEEVQNSVLTTWQISFDHIRRQRESAAVLLSLMSFCDGKAIPEHVLRMKEHLDWPHTPPLRDAFPDEFHLQLGWSMANRIYDDSDTFEEDLVTLRNFSLITVTVKNDVFAMHQLVQLAIRTWLGRNGSMNTYWTRFLNKLYNAFLCLELIATPKRTAVDQLLPHVKITQHLVSQQKFDDKDTRTWSYVLSLTGYYMAYLGRSREADDLSSKSIEVMEQLTGIGALSEPVLVTVLAKTYMMCNRMDEAERLLLQLKERLAKEFGEVHSNVLVMIRQLIILYRYAGRFHKERDLLMQHQTMSEMLQRSDPVDKLLMKHATAHACMNCGDTAEAERIAEEVLTSSEQLLGGMHNITIAVKATLAQIYLVNGHPEAEKLYLSLIEIGEKHFGDHGGRRIYYMLRLVDIYTRQSRLNEAEALADQVFSIIHSSTDEKNLIDRETVIDLMLLLERRGQLTQAEELGCQSVSAHVEAFGDENLHTGTIMWDLAEFHVRNQAFAKAEELLLKGLSIFKRIYGDRDVFVLKIKRQLTSTYLQQGFYVKATDLQYQVVRGTQSVYGTTSIQALDAVSDLASLLAQQDRLDELIELQTQRALILGQDYNKCNERTLQNVIYVASHCAKHQRLTEAIQFMTPVVDALIETLGEENEMTMKTISLLAHYLSKNERCDEAIERYTTLSEIMQRKLGPEHEDTIACLNTISDIYLAQKRFDQAIEYRARVMRARLKTSGREHRKTLEAMVRLSSVLRFGYRDDLVMELLTEVLRISDKVYGPDHHGSRGYRELAEALATEASSKTMDTQSDIPELEDDVD